jgi:hypothetical protein
VATAACGDGDPTFYLIGFQRKDLYPHLLGQIPLAQPIKISGVFICFENGLSVGFHPVKFSLHACLQEWAG